MRQAREIQAARVRVLRRREKVDRNRRWRHIALTTVPFLMITVAGLLGLIEPRFIEKSAIGVALGHTVWTTAFAAMSGIGGPMCLYGQRRGKPEWLLSGCLLACCSMLIYIIALLALDLPLWPTAIIFGIVFVVFAAAGSEAVDALLDEQEDRRLNTMILGLTTDVDDA